MNWCIIKHKWEYKIEDITFSNFRELNLDGTQKEVTISNQVRLCKRCHKKQRSRGIDWVEWELTLEEEKQKVCSEWGQHIPSLLQEMRDKKLNQIL